MKEFQPAELYQHLIFNIIWKQYSLFSKVVFDCLNHFYAKHFFLICNLQKGKFQMYEFPSEVVIKITEIITHEEGRKSISPNLLPSSFWEFPHVLAHRPHLRSSHQINYQRLIIVMMKKRCHKWQFTPQNYLLAVLLAVRINNNALDLRERLP